MIADIAEDSGDESEEGFRVGEDASDACSAFDFLAEAFCGVGGAEIEAMVFREGEDGEAFRDVGFEPGGKFWSGFAMGGDHGLEEGFGEGPEGAAKISRSWAATLGRMASLGT